MRLGRLKVPCPKIIQNKKKYNRKNIKGADAEVEYAKKIGIPVFYNLEEVGFEA